MSNTTAQTTASNSQTQLRSYIERIERLEEEKAVLSQDITSIYQEAKANGYDAKAMRRIISIRKLDPKVAEELDALVDLYKNALGMI